MLVTYSSSVNTGFIDFDFGEKMCIAFWKNKKIKMQELNSEKTWIFSAILFLTLWEGAVVKVYQLHLQISYNQYKRERA